MENKRAFSLIELLVTITIIVVLAALVIPAATSARRSAQDAQSLSNLRQIGTALSAFVGENNGSIMPRAYASAAVPAGQYRYWTANLYNNNYLRDKRTFYDPRFPPYRPDNQGTSMQIETGTPATYGMRDWVRTGESIGSLTIRVAKPVSVVSRPADFFIVADSYWVVWGTQGYGISPGENSDNRVRLDKQGMAGALFLDGHVEKKPKEYFETLDETQGEYSGNQPFTTWSPTAD